MYKELFAPLNFNSMRSMSMVTKAQSIPSFKRAPLSGPFECNTSLAERFRADRTSFGSVYTLVTRSKPW